MMTMRHICMQEFLPRGRSFTLIELLVVIGILALLSVLTAVGYQSVANDAKLSSGTNAVTAVLDNARALAMKKGRIIAAVFRAVPDGTHHQRIEASLAEWTGESYLNQTAQVVDRFRLVSNIAPRMLPRGVQVAAPAYGGQLDDAWFACSYFPGRINSAGSEMLLGGEAPGSVIVVMYSPSGTVITRNSQSDSDRTWIDFDNDSLQRQAEAYCDNNPAYTVPGSTTDYPNNNSYCDMGMGGGSTPGPLDEYFCHRFPHDEPFATTASYLAVYDHDAARKAYSITTWNDGQTRRNDLSDYIRRNVTPIHFNRYSGVAMK